MLEDSKNWENIKEHKKIPLRTEKKKQEKRLQITLQREGSGRGRCDLGNEWPSIRWLDGKEKKNSDSSSDNK